MISMSLDQEFCHNFGFIICQLKLTEKASFSLKNLKSSQKSRKFEKKAELFIN